MKIFWLKFKSLIPVIVVAMVVAFAICVALNHYGG